MGQDHRFGTFGYIHLLHWGQERNHKVSQKRHECFKLQDNEIGGDYEKHIKIFGSVYDGFPCLFRLQQEAGPGDE